MSMGVENIRTVSDLFPRLWLKAQDLGGRAVRVKIAGVDVREFRQPDGSYKVAAVLSFERATKKLILNKTQTLSIADALGTERLAEWVGKTIVLSPAVAHNGRPTIAVKGEQSMPANDRVTKESPYTDLARRPVKLDPQRQGARDGDERTDPDR